MPDYGTPIRELIADSDLPLDFLSSPDGPLANVLDKIYFTDFALAQKPNGITVSIELLIEGELALGLPGLDGFAFVFGSDGSGATLIDASFVIDENGFSARLDNIVVALRFPPSILKPVADENGGPAPAHAQIEVKGSVVFDHTGSIDFEGFDSLSLKPAMIADSGVVISAEDVKLDFSRTSTLPEITAAGFDDSFIGIYIGEAKVKLPEGLPDAVPSDLVLRNCAIGSGGVSGKLEFHYTPTYDAPSKKFIGHGSGTLFDMPFAMKDASLEVKQNTFLSASLTASMLLPFFEAPVDVELGFSLSGGFTVKLSSANGLFNLNKPDILELSVQSLGFGISSDTFIVKLSGKIRPLIGGLDWPGFEVKELSIDSHGNVKLEGGWIDLRDGYSLEFHGFKIEITKLGFGKTDDGGQWIGFSGSMNLVDGFSAGASVEGLKIIWYEDGSHDPKITIEGIGVELEIPNAVSFKGHVSYREFTDTHGDLVHQFTGDIKLKLLMIGLEVDAVLIIGSALKPDGHTYTFFAIYLAVELPAGIPLWSTGLALYGLAGLFALQMEPDKHADEEWYGVGPNDGWYKRPDIGVTDLAKKWRNEEGSLALGGGFTIGTVVDNGYTFSGRMLLLLIFPGPILMIEGKANMLKERSKLTSEPIFRALAVLDGRAGTFLFGLDAQYKVGDGGELLDIHGGVEAYFDFHDLDRWHLYLGMKEPREKRIRAHLFSLFEANTYFMVDAHSLQTGSWVGYDKTWRFGPVSITLEAWLETNVAINWKPIHFHGDLWAHGKVALRIFGFGFSLTLDAKLEGDVFDPFHILASVSVEIDLPWPLPDFSVEFSLEWGPEPDPPPLPMPLKEVAVEHFKVTTSWPLERSKLLLPNFDQDGFIGAPAGPSAPADLSKLPIVPLDCRPHITFGRAVHDVALVGGNPQPPNPAEEWIGDPAKNQGPARVKYILKAVVLEKYNGGSWVAVARKAADPNPPGVRQLFGSWAPMPAAQGGSATQSVGQVKLWLWSKNPFDYTRGTSGAWDEWFTDKYPNYPCIPEAPGKYICCNFTRYAIGAPVALPHACDKDMVLLCYPPSRVIVTRLTPPVEGIDRAACFPPESFFQVRVMRPARHVEIVLANRPPAKITCIDFSAHAIGRDGNPLTWQGLVFTVFDKAGSKMPATNIVDAGGVHALNAGFRTQIQLLEPASRVAVTVYRQAKGSSFEAFDKSNALVASVTLPSDTGPVQEAILEGTDIARIEMLSPSNEASIRRVCYTTSDDKGVRAMVTLFDNTNLGPYYPVNGRFEIDHENIMAVTVTGGRFCVVRVCADLGPDPEDVLEREEMAQHLLNSTAQWSQEGAVLEPNTAYRLKITTRAEATGEAELSGWTRNEELEEMAYFRTEGPPGLTHLTPPVNETNPDDFDSGLEDLVRYVKQTVPSTVPPPGEKPILPKPVYRAYDIGVEFNEDYVDLMYRISNRDLGLYIFDSNNRPVRDAAGRLIVMANQWGKVETTTLDASEQRWIEIVNASTCALISLSNIPKDVKLGSGAPGQVLRPDTIHEARLMPLLMHEAFAKFSVGNSAAGPAGTLGRWRVVDQGNSEASQWSIAETPAPVTRYVVQNTNIWGGTTDGVDPVKPGSMLIWGDDPDLPSGHADQPKNWTDYRVTAYVRNEDNDAIGIVFRYADANNYYRFSMDAERKYRRVVRVIGGAHTILCEDDRAFQANVDYAVTVEAIGSSLRVYLDGNPILEANDSAHVAGGIGLYCWASEKARFFDIKVDDFRNADPVTNIPTPVYRFPFTTSKFAHFTHHVHSFDDKTWIETLDPAATTQAWMGAANLAGTPISDAESRAYDALSHEALGSGADSFPSQMEVTRVEQNGHTVGFLVQTSEPFDWSRLSLDLLSAPSTPSMNIAGPKDLKLASATFAANLPREEGVGLVARDAIDLRGHAVEALRIPGPLKGSRITESYYEDFNEAGHGLLFEEAFGPNALDRYKIIDQGDILPPSSWSIAGGAIRQSANIAGGGLDVASLDKPGTVAIMGDPEWSSVRIKARLLSNDNDGIGILFRYKDEKNYYRFSTDNERNFRRLVKCVNGTFTLLWEDLSRSYAVGVPFDLQLDAFGNRLIGMLDRIVLFDVIDDAHVAGQVGLYSWLNVGANFQALRIESLDFDPVLSRPTLTTLDGWNSTDAPGADDAPSAWLADEDGIHQTSKVRLVGSEKFGASLTMGEEDWDDVQLSLDLSSSSSGAMGAFIRYRDDQNYYRFSMHRAEGYRRLDKCVNGVVTSLWSQAAVFALNQVYKVSLSAKGNEIECRLDGQTLFSLTDGDIAAGKVGLYTWNNDGATFDNVWALSLATYVGSFRIVDGRGLAGASSWRTRLGEMQQRSSIGGASSPQLGTHALAPGDAPSEMRLVVEARSDSDMPMGVLFRYQDERNYYRLSVSTIDHRRRLLKVVDGVATILWETGGGYAPGIDHRFTIDTFGTRLVGYFDSDKLFDLTDSSLASGQVGLYSSRNDTVAFSSIQIATPPVGADVLFADKFAQNDLADWTFVSDATIGGPANWVATDGILRQTSGAYRPPTNVGDITKRGLLALAGDTSWTDVVFRARLESSDADAIGIVFRYRNANNYYRFSMSRSQKYRRLVKRIGGVFTAIWRDDYVFELNRSYEVVIVARGNRLVGYFDGVPMFIVDDPDVGSGRIGLYCWRNSGAKFSCVSAMPIGAAANEWSLSDDFPYLAEGRWDFIDTGTTGSPSQWTVQGGRLLQKSAIDGTFAASQIETRSWADYRLSAHFTSSTDGTMGLAVRYQDPDNHYRFELGSGPAARRLVKVVAGVETVLWNDTKGYKKNAPVVVSLECVGEQISCYVNGVLACDIADSEFASGRIALYASENTGASFGFVRVQAAGWQTYYRFPKQPKCPAGYRLRVLSGSESDAPPTLPTVTDAFVAGPNEQGSIHFLRKTCHLRVIDPRGEVLHARTFLRPSLFTPVPGVKVLRRADGTGVFIARPTGVPEGSRLERAEYRLALTYRRNNTVIDANSQILREAGHENPEETFIDIPWE